MKKYIRELIIIFLQLLVFYLLPLFVINVDPIGLVVFILLFTFCLSVVLVIISKSRIKYFYSILTSILFIPSIFIYYNDSALIYILFLFIISFVGIGIGNIFLILKNK